MYKFPYKTCSYPADYFHAQKKRPKASGTKPMPQPLPALNIRADFHSVAKSENQPAVRMNRCVIYKPVEQFLVEIHRQLPHLA